MAEWEDVIGRFEAGDAQADDLRALLDKGDLPEAGAAQVREALELAGELGALWAGRGPTPEHFEALKGKLQSLPLPDVEGSSATVHLGATEDNGRRLLAEVISACGASEATLWLLNSDGTRLVGTLNCIRGGGRHEALEGLEVPVADSAIGQAMQQGKPVLVGAGDYQDPLATWSSGVDVSAMIAVPLHAQGCVRGVLSAINPKGGRAFDVTDVETLAWKAHLMGLVLQECFRPQETRWLEPWRE